jgi:hypothetical protein
MKPEVAVLGAANHVIEQTGIKDNSTVLDGPRFKLNPAYDLDE